MGLTLLQPVPTRCDTLSPITSTSASCWQVRVDIELGRFAPVFLGGGVCEGADNSHFSSEAILLQIHRHASMLEPETAIGPFLKAMREHQPPRLHSHEVPALGQDAHGAAQTAMPAATV